MSHVGDCLRPNAIQYQEQQQVSRIINSHPAVVLVGSPLTGTVRAIKAILDHGNIPEEYYYQAYQGDYPDLHIYDGRELGIDEARLMRQEATLRPVCWDRKYVIISYIDRTHHTVTPTLLKLIEEPPAHFSVILTTLNSWGIPATILSRSLTCKIQPSPEHEIRDWLQKNSIESIDLRVRSCAGDLDIAIQMDIQAVQDWQALWETVVKGGGIPANFTEVWIQRMGDGHEATQTACWMLLMETVIPFTVTSPLWSDLTVLALETRNKIQDGHSNKIYISTALIKAYALAVTITNRLV